MGHLEWLERPEPGKDTILIAAFSGWNDAGDAATESAKYLRRRFRCHPVAHIDPEYFYDFASVRPSVQVVEGERKIDWPTPDVRIGEVDNGRPVVTVLGVEPRLRWRTFCDVIIEMAESLGVSTVVTLGESELHSAAANYGRQIDELVAGDDTLAQYAQQILEESAAEAVEDFSEMVENPDGLIDELEQFLRQQEPD